MRATQDAGVRRSTVVTEAWRSIPEDLTTKSVTSRDHLLINSFPSEKEASELFVEIAKDISQVEGAEITFSKKSHKMTYSFGIAVKTCEDVGPAPIRMTIQVQLLAVEGEPHVYVEFNKIVGPSFEFQDEYMMYLRKHAVGVEGQ